MRLSPEQIAQIRQDAAEGCSPEAVAQYDHVPAKPLI